MLAFISRPPLPLQWEQISSKHRIIPLCGLGACKPFLIAILAARSCHLLGNPWGEAVTAWIYMGKPELAGCWVTRCCLRAMQRRIFAQAHHSAITAILHANWTFLIDSHLRTNQGWVHTRFSLSLCFKALQTMLITDLWYPANGTTEIFETKRINLVTLRLNGKCNGHLPSEKSDFLLVLQKELLKTGEAPGDFFPLEKAFSSVSAS